MSAKLKRVLEEATQLCAAAENERQALDLLRLKLMEANKMATEGDEVVSIKQHVRAPMSSEVVDSNPYSRLMALQKMGVVKDYQVCPTTVQQPFNHIWG